uniref:Uncharacterized protein n=1 Tax=Anopheles culicifacies TaxID=139723 RepID=A0A182MG26_9DIPT
MAVRNRCGMLRIHRNNHMYVCGTDDEKASQTHAAQTKLATTHYEERLLWRYDDVRIPCSREMALKQNAYLWGKTRKDPAHAKSILEKMKSYEDQGCVRRLTSIELAMQGKRDWILVSVFPVLNFDRPRKTRLVSDEATKVGNVSESTKFELFTDPYKFREHRFPRAALGVREKRYMDDMRTSAKKREAKLYHDTTGDPGSWCTVSHHGRDW